jgi:hypothetical protein
VKFIHKFSARVTCTLKVLDDPPEPGVSHVEGCVWSRQPKRKHLVEYVYWMHSVNSHLANFWQKKIGYLIQRPHGIWEFWVYEPNKPPRRVHSDELESELATYDD